MEEGKVTATGGRGAERDGADWTYLVRMYLSGCCGACSRRSLRCHTATFIHLERFEGLRSRVFAQVAQVCLRLGIKGVA